MKSRIGNGEYQRKKIVYKTIVHICVYGIYVLVYLECSFVQFYVFKCERRYMRTVFLVQRFSTHANFILRRLTDNHPDLVKYVFIFTDPIAAIEQIKKCPHSVVCFSSSFEGERSILCQEFVDLITDEMQTLGLIKDTTTGNTGEQSPYPLLIMLSAMDSAVPTGTDGIINKLTTSSSAVAEFCVDAMRDMTLSDLLAKHTFVLPIQQQK